MLIRREWIVAVASAVGLMLGAGCGGPEGKPVTKDEMQQTALSDVGELYRLYTVQKGKPPTKIEDLKPFEPAHPIGLNNLRTGDVVVIWGVTLTSLNEEGDSTDPADELLAYEKAVPESGGAVLMKNRRIKPMTADEFKAVAPKPENTSSAKKSK